MYVFSAWVGYVGSLFACISKEVLAGVSDYARVVSVCGSGDYVGKCVGAKTAAWSYDVYLSVVSYGNVVAVGGVTVSAGSAYYNDVSAVGGARACDG